MSKFFDYLFGIDEIDTYYDDEYFIQIQKNFNVEKENADDEKVADNFDGLEKTNFGVVSFNNAVMFYVIGNKLEREEYSNE